MFHIIPYLSVNYAYANYKDSCTPRLPRAERIQLEPNRFYVVEVLEKDEKCVKIHYVIYSSMHDEWRGVEDIVG